MIDLEKIYPARRRRLSSLLGLVLDGTRLDGVLVRRANGTLRIQRSFSVTLSLDPLTAEPELVAREIRNHLDAAGVREHHCAVCVPLRWALCLHSELPDLPEADIKSLLAIEAERGFPCDVSTLRVAVSRSARHALQVGLPANQLDRLEDILRRARLKPVSLSLGITALQPPDAKNSDGVLAVAVGQTHLELQITMGGGLLVLRTVDAVLDNSSGKPSLDLERIVREMRITLGQLPDEVRTGVRSVRVFGAGDAPRMLAEALRPRLKPLGLAVELVAEYPTDEHALQVPAHTPVSAAFSLAARYLVRHEVPLEFLAPQETIWQRWSARYSSVRLRVVGAAAAVLVVLVGGPFLAQQLHLMRLHQQWSTMAAKVAELEALQQKIRQYRPWLDRNFRSLHILRQLTQSFPEDGSVTAKTVEIREQRAVTCTGVAHDNAALLRVLGQLRGTSAVNDLKVSQIRGKKTMQFAFDFRWEENVRSENP